MTRDISTLNSVLKTGVLDLIIFDKDETIIKSEDKHFQAWKSAFSEYRVILSLKDYIQYGAARSPQLFISTMIPTINNETASEVLNKKERIYKDLNTKGVELIEGFIDMFIRLQRYSFKYAVASSDSPTAIVDDLTRAKLITQQFNPFSTLVSREEVKEGKPSPDIFIEVIKRANFSDPSRIIVFEDAPSGIQAAKAANMLCVARVTEFFPKAKLEETNADFIINTYNEVLP